MGSFAYLFCLATFVAIWSISSSELYKNFKTYDVSPNKEQLDGLLEWQYEVGVDFWSRAGAGRVSRVMVPPSLQVDFEKFLLQNEIKSEVTVEDVGEIEKDFEADKIRRLKNKAAKSAIDPAASPNFDVYWTSDEIDQYSVRLALNYPQLVQREVIARSFDGRDIFALKISRGGFGRKPIVFMDGGMHAREWVSQATVVYLLHRLIEDPETSLELLENVDWIIIPNLNPDGYTWSYNQDRMWRKNRNQINSTCLGVDLNRNFRYSWTPPRMLTCALSTFSGPSALSEVESRSMNDYLTRYRPNIRMYISVHSFGDMVLYPWGYSGSSGWIDSWQHHHEVGTLWADAIRGATGKNYRVGNIADLLGNAFGASDDHMAGEQEVELVYTLELTGGGQTGFDFPESQIGGLVRETFWGYRALGLYVGRTYNV